MIDPIPFDDARQWQALRAPGLQIAFLGAAAISEAESQLCEHIGAALSGQAQVAVATSGFTGNARRGQRSFTIAVAQAFAAALPAPDVERRVSTFLVRLPDGSVPRNMACIGRGVTARGRSLMNRQAQIVAKSDVLCIGGGGKGTADFARLALLIDKPVLPLPFFGGASRDFWLEHGDDVRSEFFVSDSQWSRWSQVELDALDDEGRDALAREIVATLLRSSRGTCLVCMPFAEGFLPVYAQIVHPAVTSAHLYPLRMDHAPAVGDIVASLRSEIEAARCLVAIVDDRNPNVLYEVGFAHALNKPVVLMQGVDGDAPGDPELPFDVRTHRVVPYPRRLDAPGVARAIAELHALLRAVSQGV